MASRRITLSPFGWGRLFAFAVLGLWVLVIRPVGVALGLADPPPKNIELSARPPQSLAERDAEVKRMIAEREARAKAIRESEGR